MFCKFTKKYIQYFIKTKYILDNNNKLVLSLNNEKQKISNFISNNKIIINFEYESNIDIISYCTNSTFVSNKVITELNNINDLLIFKWNNNFILLKTFNITNILIKKIKILIYIIEYLKKKYNYKKNLKIILILTLLEKYTPINNEIIGADHVNSGYSYDNNIFIWRYEEFEKVLLHEIAHVLKIDKRDNETDIIINSNIHNYFEALTDFYGIIYHIIYLSLITKINIKKLLELELSFIKNQAMKINDFFNLDEWINKPKNKIVQNTSVFSYYIIKYLLFEYIVNLNNSNIFLYLNNINYNLLLKNILNIKFTKNKYYNIKSLRMTLLQLKY